jgi:transcriptional regulator with XRE-family HTH domain
MPRIRKPKPKPDIDSVCAAVRSMRAKLRLSQQEMADQLGIALMTLSRFERGVQVPKDMAVLNSLLNLSSLNPVLMDERVTFLNAAVAAKAKEILANLMVPLSALNHSAEQWELIQCARVAAAHFPEEAKAMRQAAGEVLRLVKQVIRAADFSGPLDASLYLDLERRIDESVKQFSFERLKGGNNE